MKLPPITRLITTIVFACAASESIANITITPQPGFAIGYNGNDGDFFDPGPTPTVPNNLALPANGGTAFATSELAPELGANFPYHKTVNLNDGLYGNNKSWISGSSDGNPTAGVTLNNLYNITSIAWGRDNGNATADDCCGGPPSQASDRWPGVYDLQFTNDGANWFSIGTIDYQSPDDTTLGGLFTPWFRHEYTVSDNGNPILASGFRIRVPFAGIQANGTAIDEIEVYGTVPEPAAALSLLAGAAAVACGRRRQSRS